MLEPTITRPEKYGALVRFEYAVQDLPGIDYQNRRDVTYRAKDNLQTLYPGSVPYVEARNGYYEIQVRFELGRAFLQSTDEEILAQIEALPTQDGIADAVYAAATEVRGLVGDRQRADSAHSLCLQVVSHVMQEARDACRAEQRLAALKAEVEAEYAVRMRGLKPVPELVDPAGDIDPSVLALAQAKLSLYEVPPPLPTGGIPSIPKHHITEEDARAFRIPTP